MPIEPPSAHSIRSVLRAPSPAGFNPNSRPASVIPSKSAELRLAQYEFQTVFSGVAGASNSRRNSAYNAIGEVVVANRREIDDQLLQRRRTIRPLDGDLRIADTGILYLCIEFVVRDDVFEILLLVRSIHANEKMIIGDFVNQNVVDKAAMLVQQPGIMSLPDGKLRGLIRGNMLHQNSALAALDLNLPHVGYIEQPNGVTNSLVFIQNAGILWTGMSQPPKSTIFTRPFPDGQHSGESYEEPGPRSAEFQCSLAVDSHDND